MTIPTTEKLAKAMTDAGCPAEMIERAKQGYYDDFKSPLATPIVQLVSDLRDLGFTELAQRAIDGEFDSTKEESDAWAASPEGQEVISQLMKPSQRPKPKGFG